MDNWEIEYKIKKLEQEDTEKIVIAKVEKVMYDYFRAYITFDKSLLDKPEDTITHNIFHELCHIYTMNTLE